MATTTIPWGDGSGDNITLTYASGAGNQSVTVSSDANTGAARTKTVTFSATGVTPVVLIVNQEAGSFPVFYPYLVFDGTAYIETDIQFPADCSIRINLGAEADNVAQRVIRAVDGSGMIQFIYGSSTTSTNRQLGVYYDSTSVTKNDQVLAFSTIFYNFFMTPNGYGYGSTFYQYTKGVNHPTGAIRVGGWGSGQPFTGTMATIRIYGSDAANVQNATDLLNDYTPIYTFQPCTYGGNAGLWCEELSKFYGNSAGSGTLFAAEREDATPSSYDTARYSYYSLSDVANAYAGYSSTTYAQINLTRGSQAESYIYFKFDTSSIPANAKIVGVFCSAKILISNTGTPVPTRRIRMYSGTTAKGTATSVDSTSATQYKLDTGTWTRDELNDVRMILYAKRGTSNVNTNYYYRFYGATLYVLYTV